MKKVTSFLSCILFVLTILYPVGVILTACFGYRFILANISGYCITIAILFVCTVFLDPIHKRTHENETMANLYAVITLLTLISAFFYIFECRQLGVLISSLVSAGCCCYLTVKYGKPLKLKITALVLSGLMVLPLCFFGFMSLTFGNIGHNTVVQTIESPNGTYYAQVIDSDQGALGGDTIVNVCKTSRLNAIVFKIEKKPKTIYRGEWGEFKTMQIHWEDENCLVIDSIEYKIQ